jgi:hypothetical protein
MGTTGTIRAILLAAAMCGGVAVIATGVYDGYMLRAEAEAVQAGQIERAAEFAGRVRLLKPMLVPRLRAQIDEVAARDRRFPRELPLLEALLAIEPDPGLAARAAALRALQAGPEALAVSEATVTFAGPAPLPTPTPAPSGPPVFPAPPGAEGPLLVAEPLKDVYGHPVAPGPDGPRYMLMRRTPGGAVIPVAEAQAGPAGRTFDVTPGGDVAWVARPAERLIERWSLEAGDAEPVPVDAPPVDVAIAPGSGGAVVAFAAPRAANAPVGRRETLHVWRDGAVRRVYPPPGVAVGRLRYAWAPDGRSLLVRAVDRPVPRPDDVQRLAWVADDGRPLLSLVVAPGAPPTRWVPGPGGRMALVAPTGAWAWDGRADAAQPLVGVRGAWGWSPDGRMIAGIDVGHVFVAIAADPRRRMDHKVPELPPFFVLAEGGLHWTADALGLEGWAADHEDGPWQKVRVRVRLAARE